MKLAASNIGWAQEDTAEALYTLREEGFTGLEIAPTIAVGKNPYDDPARGAAFAEAVKAEYRLRVCSLQSIWYGQAGSIFGPEAGQLLAYTKKAVDFAVAAGAANLVFGCPKNRVRPEGMGEEAALSFFREVGAYAAAQGAVLALEANPPVYGTNFMNTTAEALDVVRRVNSPGVRLNLDFGTMLTNGERVEDLAGNVPLIHHVHISEPGLAPVEAHEGHKALAALLRAEGYTGYVSVEMRAVAPDVLRRVCQTVAEVFA